MAPAEPASTGAYPRVATWMDATLSAIGTHLCSRLLLGIRREPRKLTFVDASVDIISLTRQTAES